MKKEIEIGPGTVFNVKPDKTNNKKRTDLILELGKNKEFFTVKVKKIDEEYVFTGLPGTAYPEFIDEVVDILSSEQVIEAAKKGLKELGYEKMIEPLIKSIEENALKPKRTIRLP